MARRKNEIFSHNNKYEGNIFKKFGRWFGRLKGWQKAIFIALIVILVTVSCVAGYVVSKLDKIDRVKLDEKELSCVDVDGYINILLLGVDSRDMEDIQGSGADAIMILSIKEETGEVKLMSVYRDTYLKFGNTDTYGKITDANRIGGPAMMIQSLNQAMDMNISKFVVVNFKAVSDLVNAVGGITVDVQEEEIQQLNKYTVQTANNIGQKTYKLVESAGEQTIEGVQAVSYGRIRKGVGDDYKRTERMRIVLTKVFEKLKTMNIGKLDDLLDMMLPQVQTNLSNNDMLGLAMRLANFNIKSGAGWPYNVTGGLLNGISYVFPDNLAENTTKLHQEMFNQQDYVPSDTVENISATIISNISSSVTNQKPIDTGGASQEPDPEPATTPNPKPSQKPKPDPEPEPTPDPEPTPEPEPTPDPEPTPEPEPTPTPTPDPGTDSSQS
ncbi:LCP family protein [Anaerovoracaceae bacterium 41-7]